MYVVLHGLIIFHFIMSYFEKVNDCVALSRQYLDWRKEYSHRQMMEVVIKCSHFPP